MPSISLEETDEARGMIFCMGGHIVTLTGLPRGFSNFDLEAEIQGTPRSTPGTQQGPISKLLDQNSKIPCQKSAL